MASQATNFPVKFSLNSANNQAAHEVIKSKWESLLTWARENQVEESELDFTFEEFQDEVRLSL